MKIRKYIVSIALSVILALSVVNVSYAGNITGSNLVKNGSFESGVENWTNWEGNYAVTSDTFHSGSQSIKIWSNTSGGNEQFLQNVKVKPSGKYKFSAWVRVPSNQEVSVSLILSGGGHAEKTIINKAIPYSNEERDINFIPKKVDGSAGDGHTVWKKADATIEIPDESQFPNYNVNNISTYPNICIYFQYRSGGNWNRYTYIDDVSLNRIYTKDEAVRSFKFYQSGVDITNSGFQSGMLAAYVNMDEINIEGKTPYLIIVAYDGNKVIDFDYQTITTAPNSNGTVDLMASIEITDDMIQRGCTVSAFVWSDMDGMISITETYGIGAI